MIEHINGKGFEPGWFLAENELCERETHQLERSAATTADDGTKYFPTGAVWPANDETAVGIVYEEIDVTDGDKPGSIVTKGTVYTARLAVELDEDAKTALEALGFVFVDEPEVTRPY